MHQAANPAPDQVALFLDFDGTLIDFAPRPEAVTVPPDLPATLERAGQRLDGALALLSGRTIAELDRLLAPARLRASGIHGAEMRADPDRPAAAACPLPTTMARTVRRILADFPGTLLEDKGVTLSVHFRAVPEIAGALHAVLAAYVADHEGQKLELVAGEKVFEIKPPGFDKGAALRHFMQMAPFTGRRPVFVSDHEIDQAGFDAALALGGEAFSVGSRLPGTTGSFDTPADVRAWLRTLGA